VYSILNVSLACAGIGALVGMVRGALWIYEHKDSLLPATNTQAGMSP
jgi:hypothetical protein